MNIYRLLIVFIIGLIASCSSPNSEETSQFGEATKELIQMVDSNREIKSMLISSIEKARLINPDKKTNPVQSLEAYYDFVSHCETAMPWELVENKQHPDIYNDISKNLRYFYFLIDQGLDELEGKEYFNNSLQYSDPFASWLVRFTRSWGQFLTTEDSWNEDYYRLAVKAEAFGLNRGWYEDPSNWKTFNEFFARHLRSPEVRPIASPEDNSIVASFADSRSQGVWTIDSNSNIITGEGVPVKSASLKSVAKLIGEDSQYKNAFANGTFTHSFLAISDYHRYHFPLGGTIKEVRIIQGINPSGGSLYWDEENKRYAFDISSIGWQTIETRGCVILDSGDYGLVALIPVGMAIIGSVNFEATVKAGNKVNKGDMLGYFQFGGSDFIVIFQDKVNFTLDVPKEVGSDSYKHIFMGERLGHLTKK